MTAPRPTPPACGSPRTAGPAAGVRAARRPGARRRAREPPRRISGSSAPRGGALGAPGGLLDLVVGAAAAAHGRERLTCFLDAALGLVARGEGTHGERCCGRRDADDRVGPRRWVCRVAVQSEWRA